MSAFPYNAIVTKLLRQGLIVFLGDGLKGPERSVDFPLSSPELSEYLAAKFNYPRGESRQLERVAQYVVEVAGRGPLNDELRRVYASSFPPSGLHSFLAGLPARLRERGVEASHQLILTMNYDDCLERAFETHNEPYDVLTYKIGDTGGSFIYHPHAAEPVEFDNASNKQSVRLDDLLFTRTLIFKLLGGISRVDPSLDNFIITEEDFLEYLRDSRVLPASIKSKLIDEAVVYLGCNTSTQALRVLLNRIIDKENLRRPSWAVQQDPGPIDRTFWERRNVELIDSSVTEFIETLNSQIEIIPARIPPVVRNERETVRRAPAEYIGSTDQAGLHQLVKTVVESALDQVTAGYCDTINVVIHEDNSITVIDNGVGLPVERSSTNETTLAELAMTRLSVLADLFPTSPPTDETQQISLALVNFLSESLHLEIWRDGTVYEQDYVRGEPVSALSRTGKTRKRGKSITFKPDKDIFGTSEVSFDALGDYFREQSILFRDFRISIKDERGGSEPSIEYHSNVSVLFDFLSSSNYDDRFNAIRSITELGDAPILTKLFLETPARSEQGPEQSSKLHPTAAARREAIAETLRRIGRQELGDIFIRLTTDPSAKIVEAARSALVQLGITDSSNTVMHAHALIIAIDDYENRALKLRYTVRDAERLAAALVDPNGCGYPSQNVRLLLNKQATAKAIRESLNELINISHSDPEATFFLYFGGHGARAGIDTQAGDNPATLNLIPVDFSETNWSSIIQSAELADYLRRFSSARNVLILDCSYAALFPQVPKWALLLSSGTHEVAYESEHGSFTSVLTAALRGDVESNDGFIRIFGLYEYLQSRVTRLSKEQHPVLYADFQNNFPIGLRPGGIFERGPIDLEGFHYDVYVSFADEGDDSAWVRKSLIPYLEQANLRVAISHKVEAHQTVSRVANAQRGVAHARRTLLVLSANYLQKELRNFESALPLRIRTESRSERLVPIDFTPMKSSDLPSWISRKRPQWNAASPSLSLNYDRLVEELKKPLAVDFAARRPMMRRIDDWLTPTTPRTCLIIGSPGSGKSSLVQWVTRYSEGRADNTYPNLRQSIVVSTSLRDGEISTHLIDSLSRQLSRIPQFATALQRFTTESPNLPSTTPSDFYLRLVRPLQYVYDDQNFTRTILITIDGLDEFASRTSSNIVDFVRSESLPPAVRFLLASRPNPVLFSRLTPFVLNLDDLIARQEQLARLSSGAQKAFLWAEGLRQAQQAPQVYSEYLLAGLYQNAAGPTRRLLTLFEEQSEVSADLEVFANSMGSVKMDLREVQPAPPEALDVLNLSAALEKVLDEADALATDKQFGRRESKTLSETDLLAGLLIEPTNQSGKFIANLVQAPQETIARIITERTERTLPFGRIWRASIRRPLFLKLQGHRNSITALAFSLDGHVLYSGDAQGRLHSWNAGDGRHIRTSKTNAERSASVQSIVPLTDDHILVGWQDGVVGILPAGLGRGIKLISTDHLRRTKDRGLNVIAVSYQQILMGHQDGNVSIWGLDLEGEREQLYFDAPVTALAVTPDGRFAIVVSRNELLTVWNLETKIPGPQLGTGFQKVAVLPDSERVVCSYVDGTLAVFDITSGTRLFELPGQRHPVAAMTVIADGRQLLTASKDGGLRAWDLDSREQIFSDRNGPWEYTALAVSPDGRTIATGSNDTIVRLWDRITLFPFPPAAPAPRRYRITTTLSSESIAAGQQFTLQISLVAAQAGADAFELPHDATSLACFINSDDRGLRLKGSEAANIRQDPTTGQFIPVTFELHAQWPGTRTYSILLFADSDSPQSRIYEQSRQIRVKPAVAGEPRLPLLPAVDVRIAPQPDFVLQIDTELPEGIDGPHELTYRLSSRLPHLPMRNQEVGTVSLPAGELPRLRTILHSTLQAAGGAQPEDTREQLLSFGAYLFDRFFPADTSSAFREVFWTAADQLTTWLFVEDGVTWAPWELLVPYRDANERRSFLAERFHVSRWLELGPALYSEVPYGDLALAHYKGEPDEELTSWGQLLDAVNAGGIAEIVKRDKPCYRLHLLRYTDEAGSARRGLVPRNENVTVSTPAEDAKRARLDLRLNRPVISLSILDPSGARSELKEDWPLPDRVLPFLRAGASAVIGPWWPTAEAADHIFWLNFYDLLEARVPLGEAVWRARKMVKQSLPNSSDWLAYTLFGDPRARAYKPAPSEGYTILERLYADQPVHLGEKCFFRASISNRPSLIYQERLVQADELPKQPMALFIAPGLQDNIPEPVEMKLVGGSTVEAIYELTPEKAGKFALIARLYDGDERLQSLQLPFVVENV